MEIYASSFCSNVHNFVQQTGRSVDMITPHCYRKEMISFMTRASLNHASNVTHNCSFIACQREITKVAIDTHLGEILWFAQNSRTYFHNGVI